VELKGLTMLEDPKINIKIKLSALWVVLMLLYIYPDILMFMQPGNIQEIMAGALDGTRITQGLMLGGTIAMAISSVMVYLCLILKPQVNRWANMVLGVAYIAMVVAFLPGNWAYYIFNSCLEILVSILIIWQAWKWPRLETISPIHSSAT
jgi:hypothetical protein